MGRSEDSDWSKGPAGYGVGASEQTESDALVALYRELGGEIDDLSGPQDLVAAVSGLALRPPGPGYPFGEAASRSGTSLDLARRAWAGLGLESDIDTLSGDDVALLATIGSTAELIGEAGVIELSRVPTSI